MASEHVVFQGVFPIVPTIFDGRGDLDEAGQRSTVDFLRRANVRGMVVLANASEGYALTEAERALVIRWVVAQAGDRLPVVVACNHPSTAVAIRYAREAEMSGAAAVMALPPFFGQWAADLDGIRRHFETLAAHVRVPLILQDHPLSGIALPPSFLAEMAQQVERLDYFKIEAPRAPVKIGRVLRLAPHHIRGIFGGIGGVLFLEELAQGAAGTMPSSMIPEVLVRVHDLYEQGDQAAAAELFARYLPLINFETQLGGHRMAKEVLAMGGVIRSPMVRGPIRSSWDERTIEAFRRVVGSMRLLALAGR